MQLGTIRIDNQVLSIDFNTSRWIISTTLAVDWLASSLDEGGWLLVSITRLRQPDDDHRPTGQCSEHDIGGNNVELKLTYGM